LRWISYCNNRCWVEIATMDQRPDYFALAAIEAES
jgi:hypothetical protein